MRALVIATLLVCCGPREHRRNVDDVPWASSGVDWSKPPAIDRDANAMATALPRAASETLDGGPRIVVVENHRLPIVAITAIHRAAGGREDGALHGLAALTADALVRGTEIEPSIATDYASHHRVTTTSQLPATVAALGDALRHPTFADADVEQVRDRRLRELEERRTRPRTIAAQVFDRLIFGAHPYAWAAEGSAADVAKITTTDVRAFWQRAYGSDSLTLIFAGDITPQAARALAQKHFSTEPSSRRRLAVPLPPPPALPANTPQLAVVDMPGAPDAVVIVGRRVEGTASDADRIVREIANTILGGGVEGRLERRLHGELAITFGASSSFWRGEWAHTWTAAATFRTDAAATGLRETLALVDAARTAPPTRAELDLAIAATERGTGQRFDSVASSARAFERLVVHDDSLDAYEQRRRIAGVTPTNAQAAISTIWRDLSIVVVGDRARLSDALAATGLPIVAFSSDGRRLP